MNFRLFLASGWIEFGAGGRGPSFGLGEHSGNPKKPMWLLCCPWTEVVEEWIGTISMATASRSGRKKARGNTETLVRAEQQNRGHIVRRGHRGGGPLSRRPCKRAPFAK